MSPPPPNGYTPINDANGNSICSTSTVNTNDPHYAFLSPNGYFNINPEITSSGNTDSATVQVPICTDDEIYRIQEVILTKLNAFNLEYSNYQIYKYNDQHSTDGTKPLDYFTSTGDKTSFTPAVQTTYTTMYNNISDPSKLPSYIDLDKDLKTYVNILNANQIYRPNPDVNFDSKKNDPDTNLTPNHKKIIKMRSELDNKLMELNTVQNSMLGSSKLNADSSIYVSILWTTLATALLYYTFVHL